MHDPDYGTEDAQYEAMTWHQPEHDADFSMWARMPYWTADQAVALTFAKNPELVDWDSVQDAGGNSRFACYYTTLRELVLEAQHEKQLHEQIDPIEYFAWANKHGIDYPRELERSVLANERDITELQRKYDELQQKNRVLEIENQKLRYEVDRLRTAATPAQPVIKEEIGPKEKASLLKMVIAMAMDCYCYDPGKARSDAPKLIAQAIKDREMSLDVDTVLKYLRMAADELP
jgi:regulator of replication initiation timing